MHCSRIVPFAPLLKSFLQIGVRHPAQARDLSDALRARTVGGDARRYVRIRNAHLIDRSFRRDEFAIAVIRGFRRERGKVICQIACGLRAGIRCGRHHVQFLTLTLLASLRLNPGLRVRRSPK